MSPGPKLDLDYTTVRAPISGRIGGALGDGRRARWSRRGNPSRDCPAAPIPFMPIVVQSVGELQQLRHDFESGAIDQPRLIPPRCGSYSTMEPSIRTRDSWFSLTRGVDKTTNQVTLRGEIPESEKRALPGMYVRNPHRAGHRRRLACGAQQAVRRNDAGGNDVYHTAGRHRAVVQPVRLGHLVREQWLVLDGLKPGDRVVVEVISKIRGWRCRRSRSWETRGVSASAAQPAFITQTGLTAYHGGLLHQPTDFRGRDRIYLSALAAGSQFRSWRSRNYLSSRRLPFPSAPATPAPRRRIFTSARRG